MIVVVARHELRPEHSAEFPEQLREFTLASRAEPGVVSFEWSRSTDDPDVYFLVEVFRDGAAASEHVSSDHFQRAIALLPSLLSAPPDIIHVDSPGDGWSQMAEVDQ